jgi:hypothetical protein
VRQACRPIISRRDLQRELPDSEVFGPLPHFVACLLCFSSQGIILWRSLLADSHKHWIFSQAISAQSPRISSICNFTMVSERRRMRSNCAGAFIEKLEFSAKSKREESGVKNAAERLRQRWLAGLIIAIHPPNKPPALELEVSSSKTSKQRLFGAIPGAECSFVNSNFRAQ